MPDPYPNAELASLRDYLQRLEKGQLKLIRGSADVTKQVSDILKREVAFLEKMLARYKCRTVP
jgi:hypothetical protein